MSKSLNWTELRGLTPWVSDAIASMGMEQMTPVQASTIPLFSKNKDVVVEAVTGSGKTLAFVLPVIDRITKQSVKKPGFAVVVAPTRELAMQLAKVFESVLKFDPEETITTQCLVGGVQPLADDLRDYKKQKPDVLIGTPGRLAEFCNKVSPKYTEVLILDEADRLLDHNYQKEMDMLFSTLPKQKRVGLFSATMLSDVATQNLHRTGIRNPVRIVVNAKGHKPKTLQLNFAVVDPKDKLERALSILRKYHFQKAIVYFPTCVSVEYFYSLFRHLDRHYNLGLTFHSLHGKLKTPSRLKTLQKFEASVDGKAILLTTDVAARGIDVANVDLVLQLEPPQDPDMFVHRCGRAGRANRIGQAITLLNEGREENFVELMAVKGFELDEFDLEDDTLPAFHDAVKQWSLKDRLRHDKAVVSFVSFVRYYSKHMATSIFRLQNLDYLGVAKSYGLLRLPRMPELDAEKFPVDGYMDLSVNFRDYKYADAVKEAKRIEEQAEEDRKKENKEKRMAKRANENIAWSKTNTGKKSQSDRFQQSEQAKKKRELELVDNTEAQEEDWKDLVKREKVEKRRKKDQQVVGDFEGL